MTDDDRFFLLVALACLFAPVAVLGYALITLMLR